MRFLETRGGARLLFKYIKVHLFVQVCVCVEIYARCCAPGFHTHITASDPDPALWSEPDPVIGNAIGSDPDFWKIGYDFAIHNRIRIRIRNSFPIKISYFFYFFKHNLLLNILGTKLRFFLIKSLSGSGYEGKSTFLFEEWIRFQINFISSINMYIGLVLHFRLLGA